MSSTGGEGAHPQPRLAFDHQLPLRIGKQFRLQWEPSQGCHVLLYPEGMVQLQGGAEEIMKRIDGKATLLEVIQSLEAAFPGADLRADVVEFSEIAYAKGWLTTEPAGSR